MLLLDEPLSNLDAKLRAEMRFELKHLVQSLGVTTLYVTHDQMEALTMSDSVAVMHEGMFVEEATPQELYLRPRSAFTATFLGETNLIAGKVVGRAASDGLWRVETLHGLWSVRGLMDRRPGQRLGGVPARRGNCHCGQASGGKRLSGAHYGRGIRWGSDHVSHCRRRAGDPGQE